MKTGSYAHQITANTRDKGQQLTALVGDVPGDVTTDVTIAIGETLSTAIELLNDNDYFAITLAKGQSITIAVNSLAIGVNINFRDAADSILATAGSLGLGTTELDFTANVGGTYFIDVSSLLGLGAYSLTVGPQALADDTIEGTPEADTLNGYDGNDTIYGRAGNDTLYGSDGNDTIYGEAGWDSLFGGNGYDVINGGNGNDTIYGGNGADFLGGGEGSDLIFGGSGDDTILGGGFADELRANDGDDTVRGGFGGDLIYGDMGNDRLYGDEGNDVIYGGTGFDVIVGGSGDDLAYGGNGNDHLVGQSGHDTLYGGVGDDRIDGNGGHDTLYGGEGDDVLSGGDGNDTLYGGAGNDTFIVDNSGPGNGTPSIGDFEVGDLIALDADVFLGISVLGGLLEAEFALGTEAGDADDRIIYDQLTGNIFYDEDGAGGADQILIAQVEAGTVLDASAFIKADVDVLGIPLLAEPPKDFAMAGAADMVIA